MWSFVVIDAKEGVTEQDAKIAGIAHERGKGIIIAVNKWDAIEKNDKTIYEYTNKIRNTLILYALRGDYVYLRSRPDSVCRSFLRLIDMVHAEPDSAGGNRRAERDHD